MRPIVLFEDAGHANLQPLLYWRSLPELRIGRKIVLDRTAQRLGSAVCGVWTRAWIAAVAAQRCGAPANQPLGDDGVLVNARWLAGGDVCTAEAPCVGTVDGEVAYIACDARLSERLEPEIMLDAARRDAALRGVTRVDAGGAFIRYPWDVISRLAALLEEDWRETDAGVESAVDARSMMGPAERIHVGQRAVIHPAAVIDASAGPVFLSDDARVGAGAVVEGPIYVGPGTHIHPHAWLHGGNALGPVCRVGGELHGCIVQGYTNKQHEGYLGHAYVGSWVNIGAGSVNSDLKNTYGNVRVPINRREVDTGLRFFGAIIADHAKIGINVALPTGAVVGAAATISGSRGVAKFVPSLGWLTDDGLGRADAGRQLDAATRMMVRRGVDMSDEEVELFLAIEEHVKAYEAKGATA